MAKRKTKAEHFLDELIEVTTRRARLKDAGILSKTEGDMLSKRAKQIRNIFTLKKSVAKKLRNYERKKRIKVW